MSILSTVDQFSGTISGINQDLNTILNPFGLSAWQQQFQPASFRGVPFDTKSVEFGSGNKLAVHDYAFSNRIYVESLGLGDQTVRFEAFICGSQTTSVYALQTQLIAALQVQSAGTLIHPSLGSMNAWVTQYTSALRDGNIVYFDIEFVLAPQYNASQLALTTSTNTQNAVLASASNLQGSNVSNFFKTAGSDIAKTVGAAESVASVVSGYTSQVLSAVNTATRVVGAFSGLSGALGTGLTLGRFGGGSITSAITAATVGVSAFTNTSDQFAQLSSNVLSAATTARNEVKSSISTVTSLAESI